MVDTLNKFEAGLLDASSPRAREFIQFKRQLYAMYEVQHRSVAEHELLSFDIRREDIHYLYKANLRFVNELQRTDALDQLADNSRLGPNQIFKRRTLSPRRFKGVGAFLSAYGFYSYAPYLAAYMGSTIPVLGAVAAGLYGMLAFSESQIVNSITLIKDGSENHGKLLVTVGLSAFSSTDIIVDVKDVHSIVALGNDDQGIENQDGNVLRLIRYFDKASNQWVEQERALTLPGDSIKDRSFMDWILANKTGEGELADDFQDLMLRQNERSQATGRLGNIEILAARDTVSITSDVDAVIEAQLKTGDSSIDEGLTRLQQLYGADHLKSLTDSELYELFKRHSIAK